MMGTRLNKRADDQAISNVGPLTAFCGVAAIAVGVLVGSMIQPGAAAPQIQAQPQLNVAAEPLPEPVRVSLSPEQVDEMRTVSNLVSGAAAPVKVRAVPTAAVTRAPVTHAPATASPVPARPNPVSKARSVTKAKAVTKVTKVKAVVKKAKAVTTVTRPASSVAGTVLKPGARPTSSADKATKRTLQHAAKEQRRKERQDRRAEQRERRFHEWTDKHGAKHGRGHGPDHPKKNQKHRR